MALSFLGRKDAASARQTATRAIEYLETASARLAAEGRMTSAAKAWEAIGRLQEDVLCNEVAARSAYVQALARNASSPVAVAAMAQRAKADAQLRDKIQPAPGR
jgi:DMSO reductase anchor subunit